MLRFFELSYLIVEGLTLYLSINSIINNSCKDILMFKKSLIILLREKKTKKNRDLREK